MANIKKTGFIEERIRNEEFRRGYESALEQIKSQDSGKATLDLPTMTLEDIVNDDELRTVVEEAADQLRSLFPEAPVTLEMVEGIVIVTSWPSTLEEYAHLVLLDLEEGWYTNNRQRAGGRFSVDIRPVNRDCTVCPK